MYATVNVRRPHSGSPGLWSIYIVSISIYTRFMHAIILFLPLLTSFWFAIYHIRYRNSWASLFPAYFYLVCCFLTVDSPVLAVFASYTGLLEAACTGFLSCAYMCGTYVLCVCGHMCMSMWRPMVDVGSPPTVLSYSFSRVSQLNLKLTDRASLTSNV